MDCPAVYQIYGIIRYWIIGTLCRTFVPITSLFTRVGWSIRSIQRVILSVSFAQLSVFRWQLIFESLLKHGLYLFCLLLNNKVVQTAI